MALHAPPNRVRHRLTRASFVRFTVGGLTVGCSAAPMDRIG